MAEALATICPSALSAEALSGLLRDVRDNPRLKTANVRKVRRGLVDAYRALGMDAAALPLPEEKAVAEGDAEAVAAMLELLIGCAVRGEAKEHYVTELMSMPPAILDDLKEVIQANMALGEARNSDATAGSSRSMHCCRSAWTRRRVT